MSWRRAELAELLAIATEALWRYRLRTALSVLGVVLGVAAVIAMLSVSEGAAREALAQVDALGLDNLVARSRTASLAGGSRGLAASDAARALRLVPGGRAASPLVSRVFPVQRNGQPIVVALLGVRAPFMDILRVTAARGRVLAPTDDATAAKVCVLGATVARELFGAGEPVGQTVLLGPDYYRVIGVLAPRGGAAGTSASMAWRDLDRAAFVPLTALTGRSIEIAGTQPVDEIWLALDDGSRVAAAAPQFERALQSAGSHREFDVVVPREMLAQRYRTQRTFSIVVGSVAALALLIGGIGIMNIMLTSVVERTKEIGVRRTAGATRRHVLWQFLVEALLMTVGGGLAGILIGAVVAAAITAFAGWRTYVSVSAVAAAFVVSCAVGLGFGLYPAIKASRLEPVDAMRYE
jgi:putative ABC transport system permease protein